jgi:hypothetical protein
MNYSYQDHELRKWTPWGQIVRRAQSPRIYRGGRRVDEGSPAVLHFGPMNWKRMLAYVTGSVDEELLWVAETSSGNEVVDSAGFVSKLISHVGDCLGAPALPVFLATSQTRTGPGEFGPPAPGRGAQSAGAQAQTAGERPVVLGDLERMVAELACRVDFPPTRDCHRLATSRFQDVLPLEVPAARCCVSPLLPPHPPAFALNCAGAFTDTHEERQPP